MPRGFRAVRLEEVRVVSRTVASQDHRSDERLSFQAGENPGDFIWHRHAETDEVFIVQEGCLRIDLRDRPPVWVNAGEMFVVPKGVEHKPYAEHEVKLMLVEPQGVRNTGEVVSERSAPADDWI